MALWEITYPDKNKNKNKNMNLSKGGAGSAGNPGQAAPQVTEQTVRDAKIVECPCGGKVFSEKMMFKQISAIMSPSGKEELFPLNLVVCENCGGVPEQFNPHGIIPDELIAKSKKK